MRVESVSPFGSNKYQIDKIKERVRRNLNKRIKITYGFGTNSEEYCYGVITNVFENLFIVKLDTGVQKSITYVDVYIQHSLKYDFKFELN